MCKHVITNCAKGSEGHEQSAIKTMRDNSVVLLLKLWASTTRVLVGTEIPLQAMRRDQKNFKNLKSVYKCVG